MKWTETRDEVKCNVKSNNKNRKHVHSMNVSSFTESSISFRFVASCTAPSSPPSSLPSRDFEFSVSSLKLFVSVQHKTPNDWYKMAFSLDSKFAHVHNNSICFAFSFFFLLLLRLHFYISSSCASSFLSKWQKHFVIQLMCIRVHLDLLQFCAFPSRFCTPFTTTNGKKGFFPVMEIIVQDIESREFFIRQFPCWKITKTSESKKKKKLRRNLNIILIASINRLINISNGNFSIISMQDDFHDWNLLKRENWND